MTPQGNIPDNKTPIIMNRNPSNGIKTTNLIPNIPSLRSVNIINNTSENAVTQLRQTCVYSTHTRFLDNDDCPTGNEAHQPRVQIVRRHVEAHNRFGYFNEISKFNNIWTKKAWTSELLLLNTISKEKKTNLRDFQGIESIQTSRVHITEKMRKTQFRFNALPIEIRRIIYEYTLLRPVEKKKKSASKTPVFLRALKIYGSQHLCIEAKTTFYSINMFTYNIVKTLKFADPEVCVMFRKLLLIIP